MTDAVSTLPDLDDANAVVQAFAANYAFRAAERDELATPRNPYRRPVRPDDLEWLDYSGPMPAKDILKLSALLGHRMLRNIHDAQLLLLAPDAPAAAEADRRAYLDPDSRLLGALARPVLEAHVFAPLRALEVPENPDLGEFRRLVADYRDERAGEPGTAFTAESRTSGRREAATFCMLQLSGYAPASTFALELAAVGPLDGLGGRVAAVLRNLARSVPAGGAPLATVMKTAGLSPVTAAYWQLLLGSTLARGNLMYAFAADRETPYAILGAGLAFAVDAAACAPGYAACLEQELGVDAALLRGGASGAAIDAALALAETISAEAGADALGQVWRGFVETVHLAQVWDQDLATQLRWADSIPEYQARAHRVSDYLRDNNITVDLDTFVESCEETSTTHVHNEHRLVTIEAGQMHFWNNITHRIELNTGDKVLIPVSRLHGSTVLSGECTYHQPIISDEMLMRVP